MDGMEIDGNLKKTSEYLSSQSSLVSGKNCYKHIVARCFFKNALAFFVLVFSEHFATEQNYIVVILEPL